MQYRFYCTLAALFLACAPNDSPDPQRYELFGDDGWEYILFDDLSPEQKMLWPEGTGVYGRDDPLDGVASDLYQYGFDPAPDYVCDGSSPRMIDQLLIEAYRDEWECPADEPIVVMGGRYAPPSEKNDNRCMYAAFMLSRCHYPLYCDKYPSDTC